MLNKAANLETLRFKAEDYRLTEEKGMEYA